MPCLIMIFFSACTSWIRYSNTSAPSSYAVNVSTLIDCHLACVVNSSCAGIDWDTQLTRGLGSQCRLSSFVPDVKGGEQNVEHYSILRPADDSYLSEWQP
jgi:hypothetical protein